MPKQTAQEYKTSHREYLVREQKQHEGGIKYAEGQVQEIKEQIEQLDNSCDYCGTAIRNWGTEVPTQMDSHIKARHADDWEVIQQEQLETARETMSQLEQARELLEGHPLT